ncbi:MAG TPA: hypothetical protein VEX64_06290, partial [Pyrinomonadaceae bacterium]|nr:hypothetical protein [Pyrinomonadaceae bacterium]
HSSPPVRNNQETLIQVPSEVDAKSGTAIFPPARATAVDGAQTTTDKVFGDASETSALTRVGAVLGTPLYMSPEQCRGDKLDIRTDVYSLGIIAYQMLGGAPPFTGNYTDVLEAHKQNPPAPLEAKRVPRKVKATVMSALAKDVANRPPSAEAFVSRLRAHSEGVGALLRRGLVIYSEHLPTFLKLALLLFAPMFLLALMQTTIRFLAVYEVIPNLPSKIAYGVLSFASLFVNVFFSSILAGVTTWIVAQYLAAPLRPVTLRPALAEVRKHLRTFAGTVMPISIAALFGLFLCVVPGLILFIRYALVAPVVMMEGLRGRAALRRSTQLVKRSLPTVIAVISINLLVPLILGIFMAVVVALTSQGSEPKKTKTENSQAIQENAEGQQTPAAKAEIQNSDNADDGKQNDGIRITTSMGGPVLKIEEGSGSVEERRRKRINNTVREEIIQLLWLPVAFFIASLFSVVQALLYLKTRQAGGESMQNLLAQFEETDQPQRNWQTRLKDRLEQSGRTASKS